MKPADGRADRSAVGLGAADRGLCGWQASTRREGAGRCFPLTDHLCQFFVLLLFFGVGSGWLGDSLHTDECSYLAPCSAPTPSHTTGWTSAHPQLSELVSLVRVKQWCNHSTERHYTVYSQLSDEVSSGCGHEST